VTKMKPAIFDCDENLIQEGNAIVLNVFEKNMFANVFGADTCGKTETLVGSLLLTICISQMHTERKQLP
jgi:hypothetical protein